jgi:hypothetical protein
VLIVADLLDDREVVENIAIDVLRTQVEGRPFLGHFAALTYGS